MQTDLDELALLVALDLVLAVHPVGELDDDLGAVHGLVGGVDDLALDQPVDCANAGTARAEAATMASPATRRRAKLVRNIRSSR